MPKHSGVFPNHLTCIIHKCLVINENLAVGMIITKYLHYE